MQDFFKAPETQMGLAKPQVEAMLRDVLRIRELFLTAKTVLKHDHFDATLEPHYRVLWKVALMVEQTHGLDALFAHPRQVYSLMDTEIHAHILNYPEELAGSWQDELMSEEHKSPGMLRWIYTCDEKELSLHASRKYLQQFLQTRSIQAPLQKLLIAAEARPIKDLPKILRTFVDQQASIVEVDNNPIKSISPNDVKIEPVITHETGITFLDSAMNGGQAQREVYGVLGAYSSGKTTLAVQLVCETARRELERAKETAGYEPRHSFLFHYEAGQHEILGRVWSYLAEIDAKTIRTFNNDLSLLSTSDGSVPAKPYEKERWKEDYYNPAANFIAERERFQKIALYEDILHTVDMSCPPEAPSRGTGYVDEIAQILTAWAKGMKIGTVVIDYAGLAARRHMNSRNMGTDQLRHLVGGFGDECLRQIASPHECSVWIMHQLAAAQNKRTAATLQHHADAAEAKNFAENLWFCFNLGTKFEEHNCVQLTCSKPRRAAPVAPKLLWIDGTLSRLEDAKNRFYLVEGGHTVVLYAEAQSFGKTADVAETIEGSPDTIQETGSYDHA